MKLEAIATALEKHKDSGEAFIKILTRCRTALENSAPVNIPITSIVPFPNQPRKYFSPVGLQRLSKAIQDGGQIARGLLRKPAREGEPYQLIDGERRWRSIGMIPLERRPLYKGEVIEADEEVVQFLIAGMANFNREGHTALETADTIDRYHRELGMPMDTVADLLGISVVWAYEIQGLLRLSVKVQELLSHDLRKDQRLPVTAAIHLSKLPNPAKQLELAGLVIAGQITLPRLRAHIVEVADDTETSLRVRVVAPGERWRHRYEKLEPIERGVKNFTALLEEAGLKLLMGSRPDEVRDLAKRLEAIEEALSAARRALPGQQMSIVKRA